MPVGNENQKIIAHPDAATALYTNILNQLHEITHCPGGGGGGGGGRLGV